MKQNKLLSEVDASYLERSHVTVLQLYRNTLRVFARAFQNDHNNISDAVEQDRSTG